MGHSHKHGSESSPQPPLTPLYAAVDIGSNNVRMNLYGVEADGTLKKIKIAEPTTFPCKLAENMIADMPAIERANLTLAVGAMRAFDAILSTYAIPSQNVCAVATEALRAVENTRQGQQDIARLVAAFGSRPLTIITGEEEAYLVGEAVKMVCPKGWQTHRGKKRSAAFAAIGGGSIELGIITADGKILSADALSAGIHILKKSSGGRIPKAGRVLEKLLDTHYTDREYDVLFVVGRAWRSLGEVVCQSNLPATLHHKKTIRRRLVSATHRDPNYFRTYGDRMAAHAAKKRRTKFHPHSDKIAEGAEDMPIAAAMLRRVATHFDAKKIVFLDITMRDAMAQQMVLRDREEEINPKLARVTPATALAVAQPA